MHHINLLYCVSTALWDLLSAAPQLATTIELNPENAKNEKKNGGGGIQNESNGIITSRIEDHKGVRNGE